MWIYRPSLLIFQSLLLKPDYSSSVLTLQNLKLPLRYIDFLLLHKYTASPRIGCGRPVNSDYCLPLWVSRPFDHCFPRLYYLVVSWADEKYFHRGQDNQPDVTYLLVKSMTWSDCCSSVGQTYVHSRKPGTRREMTSPMEDATFFVIRRQQWSCHMGKSGDNWDTLPGVGEVGHEKHS